MRTIKKLLIILILIVAACAVWLALPHDPNLLDRAKIIANTRGWHEGRKFHNNIGAHWLNDHEIIFCRFHGPNERRVCYKLDTRTGQETELPALTKACDVFETESHDSHVVSPDGKWFAWSDRWGPCMVSPIDGSSKPQLYDSLNDGDYRRVIWYPDSRHWLEIYHTNGQAHVVALHDVARRGWTQRIRLEGNEEAWGRAVIAPTNDQLLTIDSDRRDLGEPYSVAVMPVEADPEEQPVCDIKPPVDDSEIASLKPSPNGDRFALILVTDRRDRFREQLHKLLRFFTPQVIRRIEVWTCTRRGADLKLLGIITPVPDDPDTEAQADPLDVKWFPGGQSISFEWKDRLYTMPVD